MKKQDLFTESEIGRTDESANQYADMQIDKLKADLANIQKLSREDETLAKLVRNCLKASMPEIKYDFETETFEQENSTFDLTSAPFELGMLLIDAYRNINPDAEALRQYLDENEIEMIPDSWLDPENTLGFAEGRGKDEGKNVILYIQTKSMMDRYKNPIKNVKWRAELHLVKPEEDHYGEEIEVIDETQEDSDSDYDDDCDDEDEDDSDDEEDDPAATAEITFESTEEPEPDESCASHQSHEDSKSAEEDLADKILGLIKTELNK